MQPSAAQVQAPLHHQQPTVVSNLAIDQVLALLSEAFVECEGLGLQAKRALACTCSTLRPVIFQLLRQPRLLVQESDAIWDNARFVAIVLVPNAPKQVLCVAGETCVPEMKLAHLRTLPKLKVGAMGPTAALFFGAAIAESDCVLRLARLVRPRVSGRCGRTTGSTCNCPISLSLRTETPCSVLSRSMRSNM